MEILYWFESIRNPILDAVMSAVTRLGEETVFMVIAMFVFWCVDKRKGYYLLSVGFIGTLINQWLKIVCRVPRPWVKDPDFTIVESAREAASGYSFPSGHTQSVVGTMGGLARSSSKIWVRTVCIILAVLTAVSRMYLGVHTPADVGVSVLVALVLVFVLYPLVESTLWFPKRMYAILGGMLALSLAFVGFLELFPFPADIDAANLASALKNAYTMAGSVSGLLVVYALESNVVKFSTRAPWWGQIIKLLGGFAITLAIKVLLKTPLLTLFGGHDIANSLRYFIIAVFTGFIWPMTFRVFDRYSR